MKYGQVHWGSSDSKQRYDERQPYLSYTLQLDNRREILRVKQVSKKLNLLYFIGLLGTLGGLYGSLSGVVAILVSWYARSEFAENTVSKIFMTKRLNEEKNKESPSRNSVKPLVDESLKTLGLLT